MSFVTLALLLVARASASASARTSASTDDFSLVLESPLPVNTVGATFTSYNVDPSCNRGFHQTNFSNPNLIAAARGLYPSRLRMGGSGADFLYYGLTPGSPECGAYVDPTACFTTPDYFTPGCLNTSHLNTITTLASGSESELLFGISYDLAKACDAGNSYVWDPSPATALLHYFAAQGIKVWGLELGNELNNRDNTTSCRQLPSSQAAAFNTLADLVAEILPGTRLVGPDSGGNNPLEWLQGFLPLVKPGVLAGITHHVYNGLSKKNWNSPQQLDEPLTGGEIAWYINVTASLYPSGGAWAGENGPTGGGNSGTCGSNSTCGIYSSSIWYSDDMALRAKYGFTHYQRQDLFGGAYGLTSSLSGDMALGDEEAIALTPDYWVAFLWKRCLGAEVYNLTSSSPTIRGYAFSGPPPSPFSPPQCGAGGLQLLLLNLDDASVGGNASTTSLPTFGGMENWAAWTITPVVPGDVFGKRVAVNGVEMQGVVDGQRGGGGVNPSSFLETIGVDPQVGSLSEGITLPPTSSTFICYF